MNTLYKYTLIFFTLFFFSACELFEDSAALQEKKQELELKKIQVQQEQELARLQMQTSLATIEKEKTLELQKMQNEIKEKELSVNGEKELELIKQKLTLQESNNLLDFQKYILIFLAFVVMIIAAFFFYYLKKKREDELIAYNDNLKKYFYIKENETRMKIAEKILDTISDGHLSTENEQKLINAFSKDQFNYDEDAEIIEALEHNKEDNEVN